MTATHQRTWHWQFDKPPATIWRVFADTARFNEATGFPPHTISEVPQPDGSIRYFASGQLGSYRLEWEEVPTNWVESRWFTHERRFSKGPFSKVIAHVELEATNSGCLCHYTLTVQPANVLGHLLLLTGFFEGTGRKFAAMAASARNHVEGLSDLPFDFAPPQLASGAEERCRQLLLGWQGSSYHHDLGDRLQQWILERPDADVWTMRPKQLARAWKADERQVIELFLLAAKRGMLSLHWDLLCPNCRVGKTPSTRMDEIPLGTHCSTCNIDYGRDFNRNVELVFQPSKSIRPLAGGDYCLFGPMSTPHILLQVRVEPDQSHSEFLPLPAGTYRLRTLEPGNDIIIDWHGEALPELTIGADDQLSLAPHSDGDPLWLQINNRSQRARVVIVEQREWMRDVLTAKEATLLQCFRDMFDEHLLRPGDHVEIDSVTLMFTDIKASTQLYERIGDAAAFALVREHFALLAGCVRRHNGTIVKTLGDAIMAAFNVPLDAVVCAQAIQAAFAAFNNTRAAQEEKVVVKLGLHRGPCIAVTLNGILDYYGQVANQTARLQSLSEGGDIILSRALAEEPGVEALLATLTTECGASELKGISGDTQWVRITAR